MEKAKLLTGADLLWERQLMQKQIAVLKQSCEDYRQEIEGLLRENERLNMVLESYRISLENIGRMKNYAVKE